ncbi:NAD kinase [Virgibacillus xinjiangensis]|uniref:NAD kinase n=1 Tax=Virgibacillus xinjiangensis TaxID=393090 RepID=A0ABV7CUU8_9BACI
MAARNKIFFYSRNLKELEDQLQPLYELAESNGFLLTENDKEANIIISVGGDGTFLQAVRKTGFRQDCLYAGITMSGESGLYCDFDLDNSQEMLKSLQNEELEVRRFPVIDAVINGERTYQCLNELSLRSSIIKTIAIQVQIDGNAFETFRGDGLIVATPTGSTGYNKSIHGAVMDPLLEGFQVSELASLNNNRYRTLGSSFILGKERTLTLEVIQDGNDYPIIGLDNEAYPIQNIKDVEVTLSDKMIKTVKLKHNSYWERVRRTFL